MVVRAATHAGGGARPHGLPALVHERAVNSQWAVARQKLAEAYRGQLALLRDRLDCAADAVICLIRDGSPAYPAPVAAPAADPVEFRPDWANARGLENTRGGLTAAA